MKSLFALSMISLAPVGALACPRCAPAVRAGVFNADFLVNLVLILAPLVLVSLMALALHKLGDRS